MIRRLYLTALSEFRDFATHELWRVIGERHCPVCLTSDPCYVHCYTCGVDCTLEEVVHGAGCPAAVGLTVVTEEDVYLNGGLRCCCCNGLFSVGDMYHVSHDDDDPLASQVVCVACAAAPSPPRPS